MDTGLNLILSDFEQFVGILSNVWFLITIIFSIVLSFIGHWLYLRYRNRLLRRMFNNSKNRIGFVGVTETEIKYELDLLKESKLVKIDNGAFFASANDITNFNFSTLILGILGSDSDEKKTEKINAVIDKLNGHQDKRIALIIYTFRDNRALKSEHWKLLEGYKLHYMANFPMNLLDGVLVSLMTIEKNFKS